jgi:hypothetical protein
MSINLQAALRLAAAGLAVFPCCPASKRPRVGRWQSVATTVERGVLYFWHQYGLDSVPGIGLGRCGLVVPDLDVKNGVDGVGAFDALTKQYGEPEPCPVTRTISGGLHVILKQPGGRAPLGNSTGSLPAGIDVRGAGGFVIAPGAGTGEYYESIETEPDLCEAFKAGTIPEIMPWFVELIEAKPHGSDPSLGAPRPAAQGDKSAWVAAALQSEAIALAYLDEGGRNNELNRLVYMFAGHAANGWTTRDEVYAAMQWACKLNAYLDSKHPSDGPQQFEKTFCSGWNSGFRKPTSGPAEPVVRIDLKPKAA